MSERRAEASDRVTVLVFKDNLSSRTFQISLGWIARLGSVAALLAVILLASLYLAVKYYRAAAVGDPGRVRELELELGELRAAHGSLQEKLAAAPVAEPTEGEPPPIGEPAPTLNFTQAQPFQAVPTPPAGAPTTLPAETELPFRLTNARVAWEGSTLRASYNIQYVNPAGGSQQGRIVMLARGPGALHAYPPQVLQPVGADTLIAPLRGEYFSVSRFRAVRADFGPIPDRGSVREIEILLFNSEGHLITHRRLGIEGASARGGADAKPRTEPARSATPPANAPAAVAPAAPAPTTAPAAPEAPKATEIAP